MCSRAFSWVAPMLAGTSVIWVVQEDDSPGIVVFIIFDEQDPEFVRSLSPFSGKKIN
jgi:hypothetical protein